MMARTSASVGLVVCGGLLASALISACSSSSPNPLPSPGTSGSATGGSAGAGGSATAGGGAGSSAGGAMGIPQVNGACPSRSVKHPDGLCYCLPATLSACANGCGDFQVDPDHCGDCNTKCGASQACSAGKCSVAPTTLVPAAAGCGAMHLAVAGGTLYWTDKMHGTLSSVSTKAGGAPMMLVQNQMAPTLLSVHGTSLYWLATGSKSVMTATTAGATPMAVATSPTDDIGGFTLSEDGASLYFSAGTKVSKTTAAPAGTPSEVGHEDSGIPKALAVAGNLIAYPADMNGDVDVMTVVPGTPSVCASPDSTVAVNMSCARLARSQGGINLENIFIVGDGVYWANDLQISTSSATMSKGVNDTVAMSPSNTATKITAFTISNSVVYFTDDSGSVYKAPLMLGGAITTLARAQMSPSSIVADDANVYWATSDCAIMSLPTK
jgi:hypothetical protein